MINKFFTLIKYIKEKTNLDIDLSMTVSDLEKWVIENNLNIPERSKNFDIKRFKKSLILGYDKSRNSNLTRHNANGVIFVDFKTKSILTNRGLEKN